MSRSNALHSEIEISNLDIVEYPMHIQPDSNDNPCAYYADILVDTGFQKNNMHHENLLKLQIENYDINISLDDIKKQNIDIQLDYFYFVFEYLKFELDRERNFNNTILDENEELREVNKKLIIESNKIKNDDSILIDKYNSLLAKSKELEKEFNLIKSKDKKYIRIKQDKRIIKQQQKQLKQMHKDNDNYKNRLNNVVNAPLSENQTEQILMLYAKGMSQKDIANKLNIAQSTISRKINNKHNQERLEQLKERLCI